MKSACIEAPMDHERMHNSAIFRCDIMCQVIYRDCNALIAEAIAPRAVAKRLGRCGPREPREIRLTHTDAAIQRHTRLRHSELLHRSESQFNGFSIASTCTHTPKMSRPFLFGSLSSDHHYIARPVYRRWQMASATSTQHTHSPFGERILLLLFVRCR